MKHFNLLGTFAIIAALAFGVPAMAQQLHTPTPGLASQHLALADDPSNPIAPLARAEEASFVQFTQTPNDGHVGVPWGDWLGKILTGVGTLIAATVAALASKFFGGRVAAEDLRKYTDAAVSYGINLVAGAAHGQALQVPIANQVLERALEYSVDMFGGLVDQFGGTDAQRQRILSRLNVSGSEAMAAPARTMAPPVHVEAGGAGQA